MMSKFTPAEIARIRAESERLLRDDAERPEPAAPREVPPLEFEDATTKWARQAEERNAERQAERTRRQREELRAQADAATIFWEEIDRRIQDALAAQAETFIAVVKEMASSCGELAEAVDRKLGELERGLKCQREERASHLDKLGQAHDRRFDQLRGEIDRRLRDAEAAYAQRVVGLEHQLDRANVTLNQRHADKRADERHEATIIELRDLLKRPN
jgi:hypothetical protein